MPTVPVPPAQATVSGGLELIEQFVVVVPAAVPRASVTVAVKVMIPGPGGTPLRAPVAGINVNHGGRPVAENV